MYAFSEMTDHVARLQELHAPFAEKAPGVAGSQDCENRPTRSEHRGMITEEHPSTRPSRRMGSTNAVRLPGSANPVDFFTETESDFLPLPSLLKPVSWGFPQGTCDFPKGINRAGGNIVFAYLPSAIYAVCARAIGGALWISVLPMNSSEPEHRECDQHD